MRKSMCFVGVGALSLALSAGAQNARLDVQVSNDNVSWSDAMFAPAGSTVYVRVVASTTAPNAVGLASLVFQPTLSNWTAEDTRINFSNSTGAGLVLNSGVPASLGRFSPFASTSMSSSSASGSPASFVDGGNMLRIAGSRANTMTTNLAWGIIASQGPKSSYPTFSQDLSPVVFKYAVRLGNDPTLRTMIADVPLAGIQNQNVKWYTSLFGSGTPLNFALTAADIDPATVQVGPPNAIPVAGDDVFNMLEDQSLIVTAGSVLNNDTDADVGDTKTAELVANVAHGTLDFHADGTFSYIPAPDFYGADTFTYRVRDRWNAGSNVATVTINVTDVNDAPAFDAADPAAVLEDAGQRVVTNWASFNPGNGESQGVAQYEVVNVDNPGLFTVQPTVSNDGTLRYTPTADLSGVANFQVRVRDNGGTDNGGYDMSQTRTFSINVLPVNDAPVVTATQPAAVLEDAGQVSLANWASFFAGPGEPSQVLLGYSVSNISNPSLFSVVPTVAPDGTLVFTPAANASGTSTFVLTARDSGGTANGGSDTSAPQVFTINVTAVNDQPSFAAANPPAASEDSGARTFTGWAAFSAGAGESQSALEYLVTGVSNPAMFSVAPAVSGTGTLTYTLAANAFGTSTFDVRVRDNGGTANGGVDTSALQSFTLTVNGINDAPTFIAGSNPTVNEDAGSVVLSNWAVFNPGPFETTQSVLSYTVSSLTNSALFSAAPAVASNGTLTFATAANASGTATFQLRVRDDGGVASGGVDTSSAQAITITVNSVNDAPVVTLNPVPTVLEDAGSESVPAFASFTAGPGETSQSLLGYTVSNVSDASLFSVLPAVSTSGTLTYTIAPNVSGTVTFTVQARDNGGVTNGGVDTSAAVQATLTITSVNDAPTFSATSPAASFEDSGPISLAAWAVFNAGPGETQDVLGYTVSSISNPSLFTAAPSVANDGTLTYTPAANASGTSTFQLRVRDNGGTLNGGVDTSGAQTFTVTVTPVNDSPTVAISSLPTIIEDAGPQTVTNFASFTAGSGEAQGLLGYIVSNISNPAIFAVAPSITSTGTLTYRTAPNASGVVTFTVQSRDNGGTANGGVDTSLPVTATLNITDINDAPSFTAANPAASFEDAGQITVSNWAAFDAGPFETTQSVLAYTVSNLSNPALFAVAPSVAADGSLSYTAASNASGSATFQLRVRDNGGTASGGVDTSAAQVFTVTIAPVNDAPSVTLGSIPVIEEDSGSQVVPSFASFSPGPNESGQLAVEYLVSNVSNPAAFSMGPFVLNGGALMYSPAPNASGTITFDVRVRDNGGTDNGGQDVSTPARATMVINGVNDAPVAVARTVVIDARGGCVSQVVGAAQIDGGSYDPDNGPAELQISLSRTGEFPIGVTPVTLTVTDPAGLRSVAETTVTVLAFDENHNDIPDACDEIRGGTGPDCDGDGDSDESNCLWDNGVAAPSQAPTNGQLSMYGGSIAARVADDFYLDPGLVFHITSYRAQLFTNSLQRGARLSLFEDCNGQPAAEPFKSFDTESVATESPASEGFSLVTYVWNLCDEHLTLDGDKTYWLSVQGKVLCNETDRAYWAVVGATPRPSEMIGSVPFKALGVGNDPCTTTTFEAWTTIADCCIGCANTAWLMTGEKCQLLLDNTPVDLDAVTRGGDPSGLNRGVFSRAADNIAITPCRNETICFLEAYIWTNCNPVRGFLEIYDNSCVFPVGPARFTAEPTEVIPLNESAVIDGVSYDGYKLVFWNPPWHLEGGRNYWISVGADGQGAFAARSFFAYRDQTLPCDPCGELHITAGAKLANRQTSTTWTRATREYAFRVATKPYNLEVGTHGGTINLCPPDINRSGSVTIQDMFDFLDQYLNGCP